MLEVKFDNKTLKLYKRYFKDPLAIAKKIFSDCNAKIIPLCHIKGNKRYIIYTTLNKECYMALFNTPSNKYYNILGIATCKNFPTKPLKASEFDNIFHNRKRDIGKFLDTSSSKSVEEFEKTLKKIGVNIELDEKSYKSLEALANFYESSMNKIAKKLIEDKIKELKEKFSL